MVAGPAVCKRKKKFVVKYLLMMILCLYSYCGQAQLSICSWNLENFGKSKNEEDLIFIGSILRKFDIIAIEEVMAGADGVTAVKRLCRVLDQTGNKWGYSISDPTSSYENVQQQERYAFLWRKDRVNIEGTAALARKFEREIEREPFIATFSHEKKLFSIAAFHALPKKKQPEKEIKFLRDFHELDQEVPVIFVGDFNCPQSHTVFLPLKNKGWIHALEHQKTTLKQLCKDGACLASEYDNIFYPAEKIKLEEAGIIPFYHSFGDDMRKARKLSDHVPVYAIFNLN